MDAIHNLLVNLKVIYSLITHRLNVFIIHLGLEYIVIRDYNSIVSKWAPVLSTVNMLMSHWHLGKCKNHFAARNARNNGIRELTPTTANCSYTSECTSVTIIKTPQLCCRVFRISTSIYRVRYETPFEPGMIMDYCHCQLHFSFH